ncbi:molybdate ABC transporter substrate-binding protein [Candidatus Bathyarchaeota archaeon]|nr:molybdate ABC transporter substrate-binding protein [Candidatus Bathyarchaeota archaeon]
MNKRNLVLFSSLVIVNLLLGFELGRYYIEATKPRKIRVFFGAAAEIPEQEVVELFEEKYGISVIATFGGSGVILSSMKIAKTGDLYVPGSQDYMEKAVKDGVIKKDTITIIAYLVPAIIVPKGNPKNITCLEDLAKPGVSIGLADPETVCVGGYAVDLLEYNGLWEKVKPNVVVYVDSCLKVANLPVVKSVDAVIGWHVFYYWNPNATDIIWIEPEKIPKIAYISAALTIYVEDEDAAKKFLEFLTSDESKEIFRKYNYFATVEEAKKYAPNAIVPSIEDP